MADEKEGFASPPLPTLYEIPVQLLEQWVSIPTSERMQGALTKQDIDNLVFGLLRLGDVIQHLDETIVSWSNGNIQGANASIYEARRINIESQNFFRRFITGLMVAMVRGRSDGG